MNLKKQQTIHIGEVYASVEPTVIKTLLGSCVAVCLFDPVKKIGAMNHIFLPGRADLKHFDAPARFGINAMELLINEMMKLGAGRHRLLAKAFGGGHVLHGIDDENGPGRKISDFVTEFLQAESIRLAACDLGGNHGRHVHFETDTGDAWVKKIPKVHIQNIRQKEQKAFRQIRKKIEKPGNITLFKATPFYRLNENDSKHINRGEIS